MREAAAPRQEDRPVLNGLKCMDEAVRLLHDRIGMLENRLEAVLGPAKPQPVGPDGAEQRPTIAAELHQSAGRIQGATHQINSIMDRLEL